MKVELHINGRLNIQLTPETDIESVVLKEMVANAEKGKVVKMEDQGDDVKGQWTVSLSVEK